MCLEKNKQMCGFLTIALRGTAVQYEYMTPEYSHLHMLKKFNTDVEPVCMY